LILIVGILIGRLAGPRPVDAEQLKAEVRRAVLADVDRRLNLALADTADQMQVMAAQLASGSKAMMDARLTELIQLIETARRTDRQRVADALMQMELSRQDDRNQIAASLRSLATPAAELSGPAQKVPTTADN
jgi:formate dehydrogenase maturation protein FdhE